MMKPTRTLLLAVSLTILPLLANAESEGNDGNGDQRLSLMTANADEGFALAIDLARRSVTTMQTDKAVLIAERPAYAKDAEGLIAASEVVAVHFQTIAAANEYWRDAED